VARIRRVVNRCEAFESERSKAERVASSFIFRALSFLGLVAASAAQELSEEELAKTAQNPIANLISVPFQNYNLPAAGLSRAVRS